MGADHWAVCPRCKRRAAAKAEARTLHVAQSYGKVPADQYDAMLKELAEPPGGLPRTLSEYYEITGAETGTIKVSYGAGCEVCGLSVSFSHVHEIDLADATCA